MRISDWISDVCSSDLGECTAEQVAHELVLGGLAGGSGHGDHAWARRSDQRSTSSEGVGAASPGRRAHRPADRKRVVEGKRVPGRVDLGGRRIMKTDI